MTRQAPESFGSRATAVMPVALPRLAGFDHGFSFLKAGDFIGKTCEALGTDGFRARIFLRDTICLRGPDAAALFYGRSGLRRARLWGRPSGIAGLEGDEHRRRKGLFIRMVMDPARLDDLVSRFAAHWVPHSPAEPALTRAACEWLGLCLTAAERERLISFLARAGHQPRPNRGILRLLGRRSANIDLDATDLLHVVAGITAVGRFIAAADRALTEYPMWADLFHSGTDDYITDFAEEVRRITPAAPNVVAVATEDLTWRGVTIPAGTRLLLDLHATNRDARLFPQPDRFRPERMLDWRVQDDGFVPQGGGKVERSHRCPGEMATLALMSAAIRAICRQPRPATISGS